MAQIQSRVLQKPRIRGFFVPLVLLKIANCDWSSPICRLSNEIPRPIGGAGHQGAVAERRQGRNVGKGVVHPVGTSEQINQRRLALHADVRRTEGFQGAGVANELNGVAQSLLEAKRIDYPIDSSRWNADRPANGILQTSN